MRTARPEATAARNPNGSYGYRLMTIEPVDGLGWRVTFNDGKNALGLYHPQTLREAKAAIDKIPPQSAVDRINAGGDFSAYFYDDEETVVWGAFTNESGESVEWHCGEIEEYGCLHSTVEDYTLEFERGRPE